jgi:probable HAF family extracellular repeat protein
MPWAKFFAGYGADIRWQGLLRGQCFFVFVVAFVVNAKTASAQYTITDLGTLGGLTAQPGSPPPSSEAFGINNSGQVVGYALTASRVKHAFLESNGSMTDLGTFGSSFSIAMGINGSGQIAVTSFNTVTTNTAAYLYSNGKTTNLGTLGGSSAETNGIDNDGQATGDSVNASGGDHAFLYSSGHMTDLGTLGGASSRGYGVNDSGEVVGFSQTSTGTAAFLYSGGQMINFNNLLPADSNWTAFSATGINDGGQVVGAMNEGGNIVHGFLYSNGTTTDLGTIGTNELTDWSYAEGVNDLGEVVGYSTYNAYTAFLYSNGQMINLNSLLPTGAQAAGWYLGDATAINDEGQIVGWGWTPAGHVDAFLLSPTSLPEPSSLAMLSLICLLLPRWRDDRVDKRRG